MTRQYYIHDGTGQQGPFTLQELIEKNISQATPVWYDGLGHWTSAAQLEELKPFFSTVSSPFIPKQLASQADIRAQSRVEQDRKKGMNVLLLLVMLAILVAIGVYFANQAVTDTAYGSRYVPGLR